MSETKTWPVFSQYVWWCPTEYLLCSDRRRRFFFNRRPTRTVVFFTCLTSAACLPACLFDCLSICLSVYLPICISAYLPICQSPYLPISLSPYLPISLSVWLKHEHMSETKTWPVFSQYVRWCPTEYLLCSDRRRRFLSNRRPTRTVVFFTCLTSARPLPRAAGVSTTVHSRSSSDRYTFRRCSKSSDISAGRGSITCTTATKVGTQTHTHTHIHIRTYTYKHTYRYSVRRRTPISLLGSRIVSSVYLNEWHNRINDRITSDEEAELSLLELIIRSHLEIRQ